MPRNDNPTQILVGSVITIDQNQPRAQERVDVIADLGGHFGPFRAVVASERVGAP
jgi:hypothetical protein